MSLPPPPPPSDQPPPGWNPSPGWGPSAPTPAPPPTPYGTAPTYLPYGQPPVPQKTSGMAITGFVLGLVALVPCFWFWIQVPGVLGIVFSVIGLKATAGGRLKGRGLAIAGLVVSILAVAIAALFTTYIYTSDDCVTDGFEVECDFDR